MPERRTSGHESEPQAGVATATEAPSLVARAHDRLSMPHRLVTLAGRSREGLAAYVVALALWASVFVADLVFEDALGETGFSTFFPVVFLAAWWGGFGPGVLATLVSTAAADYLFQSPPHQLGITSWEQALHNALFIATGLVIAFVVRQLHTAREQAEQREEVSTGLRHQLTAILSGISDAIAAIDRQGRVLYANTACATLFGLEHADELVGLPLEQVCQRFVLENERGEAQPWGNLAFAQALRTALPAQDVACLRAPGQPERWVNCRAEPVLGTAGLPEMYLLVVADITPIKRAEHDREAWMQAIAHDLSSPLMAVGGYLQLGMQQLTQARTDAGTASLARALAGTKRLAGMIQQLNDVTRMRARGTMDLQRAACDLVTLVREAADEARAADLEHAIVVEAAAEVTLMGDADRLRRVVDNLLSNALKFSPTESTITVRLEHQDGQVILSVADQGIGIPPQDLAHIFERFERADNARTVRGSGLGLSFCQAAVQAHRGQMEVSSVLGQGTTVTVQLPLEWPGSSTGSPASPQTALS